MKANQSGEKAKSAAGIEFHVYNAALAVLGAAGLIQSFSAHRVSAGWDLGLLLPALGGAFLLLWVVIRLLLGSRVIRRPGLQKSAWLVIGLGAAVFPSVQVVLVTDPLLHGAERLEKAGGSGAVWLIVLGCGITADGSPTWALANRLDKALEWYRDHPGTQLVASGGRGANEPEPEGVSMARYLVENGASEADVHVEGRSTSTMENFLYSRTVMEEAGWSGGPVLFVTNDFHVFRARMLAARNGLDAYGIPASTPAVIRLNVYLREFFALFKSLLVDWVPEADPEPAGVQ